jgi:2-haloacid dehalogenase
MAKWITFDNYGTLTNWLDGMRAALRTAGVADGDVDRLLLAYHAQEFTVESSGWLPYRDVLTTGLRRAADLTGVQLRPGAESAFLDGWDDLPIYPDVAEGLGALREEGWRLVVLTNCDDDLWARTRKNIPIEFDEWITAEEVRSYKPELEHFRAFRERIAEDDIWVHAAASWLHDIYPAARVGVPRVWVDRDLTGHPPAFADRRVEDIASLPAAVADLLPSLAPVSVPHVKSPLQ